MSNKSHPVRDVNTWLRFVFLILFGIIFTIAQYLVFVVAILLAILSLFSRTPNSQLQQLGAGLAEYSRSLSRYLSYNTQIKPFPFADWQAGDKPDADMAPKPTAKAQKASASKAKATPASGAKTTTAKTKTAPSRARKTTRARKPASKANTTAAKPVVRPTDTGTAGTEQDSSTAS